MSRRDRTLIRIWEHTYSALQDPRLNPLAKFFGGRGHVGHVSVETSNQYMSLWPNVSDPSTFNSKVAEIFNSRPSQLNSYETDVTALRQWHTP